MTASDFQPLKMLATGVLTLIVAVASLVCLLSSFCTLTGGPNGDGRSGFAIVALVSLLIAVGGVLLIGKLQRSE